VHPRLTAGVRPGRDERSPLRAVLHGMAFAAPMGTVSDAAVRAVAD